METAKRPSPRHKRSGMSVLLTKLSPNFQKKIKKPLLKKRSPMLRSSKVHQMHKDVDDVLNSIEGNDNLLHTLQPKLERPGSKDTDKQAIAAAFLAMDPDGLGRKANRY